MAYVPLFLLFLVVLVCTPILDIGKSVGEAMACFAIGFFIFSSAGNTSEKGMDFRGTDSCFSGNQIVYVAVR